MEGTEDAKEVHRTIYYNMNLIQKTSILNNRKKVRQNRNTSRYIKENEPYSRKSKTDRCTKNINRSKRNCRVLNERFS